MANFGQRVRTGNDIADLDQWMPVDLDYQNSADSTHFLVVGAGGAAYASAGYPSGGGGGGYRTSWGSPLGELSGGTPGTLESAMAVTSGTSYTVQIGSGAAQSSGASTIFGSITSLGGGRGSGSNENGVAGGSGGGGVGAGAGTAGQGYAGGSGAYTSNPIHGPWYAPGGGGAGAAGGSAGGAGRDSTITGTSKGYAGGGGGNRYVYGDNANNHIYEASHGGGGYSTGTVNGLVAAGVPRVNSGGGSAGSGAGGSGIVVIRYSNTFDDLAYVDPGLVYEIIRVSGYTIYSFTAGTGTIQF